MIAFKCLFLEHLSALRIVFISEFMIDDDSSMKLIDEHLFATEYDVHFENIERGLDVACNFYQQLQIIIRRSSNSPKFIIISRTYHDHFLHNVRYNLEVPRINNIE